MAPEIILSNHLLPAHGKTEQFLNSLAAVTEAEPFIAPDQTTFQQLLADALRVDA